MNVVFSGHDSRAFALLFRRSHNRSHCRNLPPRGVANRGKKNIALSVPRHRLPVLSKNSSVARNHKLPSTASKSRELGQEERQRRISTEPRDKRAFSLSPSFPFALFLLLSLSLFSLKEKDERRTREGEDKKRNAKERAVFFSFSFLRVSVLPAAANESRLLSHPLRNAPTWMPLESFLAAPVP